MHVLLCCTDGSAGACNGKYAGCHEVVGWNFRGDGHSSATIAQGEVTRRQQLSSACFLLKRARATQDEVVVATLFTGYRVGSLFKTQVEQVKSFPRQQTLPQLSATKIGDQASRFDERKLCIIISKPLSNLADQIKTLNCGHMQVFDW